MDTLTKQSLLFFGGLLLFLVVYFQFHTEDCKQRISYAHVDLNKEVDLDRLFLPIDSIELSHIQAHWREFEASSDSFHLELQTEYTYGRALHILAHFSHGEKHYGALIFPVLYDPHKTYPAAVWANGLNQAHPRVNLQAKRITQFVSSLRNHFIVIPSFRGQALVHNRTSYCSDGFFGDAFDGATDDALRLLALVKETYKAIDPTRMAVCGISRGGTVALLMGARDSTLQKVVSIAGPTQFYDRNSYFRYGKQYKYQFLSTTTDLPAIREKMIKSSPIYFIKDYPNSLLLIHGKNDRVVEISHAERVIERLAGKENFTLILNENGHNFYDWNQVTSWIARQ